MLLPILSGASLILGIYLLIVNFYLKDSNTQKQTHFHIGCYDPTYANNHSFELEKRLLKIDSTVRQSIKLNFYHSKALKPGFDKSVRELAVSFENFLSQYYKKKGSNDYNLNYYNQLSLAKMDFQKCSSNTPFLEIDCLGAWQKYENSTKDIEELKKVVSDLIGIKQIKQKQLSKLLFNVPSKNEEEQKRFDAKIQQLKRQRDSNDAILVELKMRKNTYKGDFSYIDVDIQQLKSILSDCLNNKQLIMHCIKISEEVSKIQAIMISKKDLQTKIAKKLMIINLLQTNLEKSKRLDDTSSITSMLSQIARHKNELSLLEYQVQIFETKQQSRCAMCSEQRIRELRKNISNLENKKIQINKNYALIEIDISNLQVKIVDINKQIDEMHKKRQNYIINQLCLDESCKAKQKKLIGDLELTIRQLRKEIIDKQGQMNNLIFSWEQKIDALKPYLRAFDQITNCLLKKNYYYELKKRQPKEPSLETNMIEVKKAIVKRLDDFQL